MNIKMFKSVITCIQLFFSNNILKLKVLGLKELKILKTTIHVYKLFHFYRPMQVRNIRILEYNIKIILTKKGKEMDDGYVQL